jgi:hypothetical protein
LLVPDFPIKSSGRRNVLMTCQTHPVMAEMGSVEYIYKNIKTPAIIEHILSTFTSQEREER